MGKDIDTTTGTGQKPVTKGFKETASRLRRGPDSRISHRASVDFHVDQRTVCDKNGSACDIVALEDLTATLLMSHTARTMLESDAAKNLTVVYDTQNPGSQFYVVEDKKIITLNPHRAVGDLINMYSRELRRLMQHAQGALVNPLSFEPEDAILVNRAQQADTFMMAVKIAYELKLSGHPEAWDAFAASSLGDISRTFEIKASADFRTLNNGEALRAAYDKFFEDNRMRHHDKRVIHQMLLEETGYIKSTEKRPRIGMDLFRKLGEVPQGKNYLTATSKRLPTDTTYATVEDRSNANFLWFVKFERSFQEKELQMIQDSVKMSAEIVDFTKWTAQNTARRLNA